MPYYPYQTYQPPMPDQLAQYRQQQYQPQPMFQQPAQQIVPQMQPQQQQQMAGQSIIWVQNEQEAYNYLVAPNSAVALWDSNNPAVYLKQADASGKPTMKIYDLVERTAQRPQAAQPAAEYVTRQEFAALQARIDALTAPKQTSRKTAPAKEDEQNA